MTRSNVSVLAAALALGCSPANVAPPPDAGDDGGNAAANAACALLASARCSRLASCSPTAVQLRYGDEPTCEALVKAVCLAAVAAPSSGQTAASQAECAQAISGWDCSAYVDNQSPPPACAQKSGALANGAACGLAAQCQSGFCAIAPGDGCGVCADAPNPGDSCARLISCGMTLVCASATSTCATFALVGAACGPGQPCTAGYACVGANARTGAAGTCEPQASTLNGACSFSGAGCDLFAGLTCNEATSQCGTAQVAAEGFACGLVAGQNASCAASGQCVAGTCVAGRPIGAPCDVVAGPPCLDLLRCVATADGGTAGRCQAPSAAGCM